MKTVWIWFAALALLLGGLSFWAGANARIPVEPADPSVYGSSPGPELPAVPEARPGTPESSPAFTF